MLSCSSGKRSKAAQECLGCCCKDCMLQGLVREPLTGLSRIPFSSSVHTPHGFGNHVSQHMTVTSITNCCQTPQAVILGAIWCRHNSHCHVCRDKPLSCTARGEHMKAARVKLTDIPEGREADAGKSLSQMTYRRGTAAWPNTWRCALSRPGHRRRFASVAKPST